MPRLRPPAGLLRGARRKLVETSSHWDSCKTLGFARGSCFVHGCLLIGQDTGGKRGAQAGYAWCRSFLWRRVYSLCKGQTGKSAPPPGSHTNAIGRRMRLRLVLGRTGKSKQSFNLRLARLRLGLVPHRYIDEEGVHSFRQPPSMPWKSQSASGRDLFQVPE